MANDENFNIDPSVMTPVYTVGPLKSSTIDGITEIVATSTDKNTYLKKNGDNVLCPHLIFPHPVTAIPQSGHSCGSFCHHFNMVNGLNKDGNTNGKVYAQISCGGIVRLEIKNLKITESTEKK